MANTRPLLTPEDRELLMFVLAAMRDDRNRTEDFKNDPRYDKAEDLFRRIIPDFFHRPA
jgi:hypothetical protein